MLALRALAAAASARGRGRAGRRPSRVVSAASPLVGGRRRRAPALGACRAAAAATTAQGRQDRDDRDHERRLRAGQAVDRRPGPTTFEVTNKGTDKVTEFEVLRRATQILGEEENITARAVGFVLAHAQARPLHDVLPGRQDTPSRRPHRHRAGARRRQANAERDAAVRGYRATCATQAATLRSATTRRSPTPSRAGDVEKAKQLYPAARIALRAHRAGGRELRRPRSRRSTRARTTSPKGGVDGLPPHRAGPVDDGHHDGMTPVADKLVDRRRAARRRRSTDVELQPAQIANGAVELLNEVSKSKITGEEERYSHIDLVDFEANVEGAAGRVRRGASRCSTRRTRARERRSTTRFAAVDDGARALPRGRRVRALHRRSTTATAARSARRSTRSPSRCRRWPDSSSRVR